MSLRADQQYDTTFRGKPAKRIDLPGGEYIIDPGFSSTDGRCLGGPVFRDDPKGVPQPTGFADDPGLTGAQGPTGIPELPITHRTVVTLNCHGASEAKFTGEFTEPPTLQHIVSAINTEISIQRSRINKQGGTVTASLAEGKIECFNLCLEVLALIPSYEGPAVETVVEVAKVRVGRLGISSHFMYDNR